MSRAEVGSVRRRRETWGTASDHLADLIDLLRFPPLPPCEVGADGVVYCPGCGGIGARDTSDPEDAEVDCYCPTTGGAYDLTWCPDRPLRGM